MKKIIFAIFVICSISLLSCNETSTSNSNNLNVPENYQNPKTGSTLSEETMMLSPYRLILNAEGRDQTMQIIFGGSIPSGYSISDYNISLYFGNEYICNAVSFRYCYIDNNFIGEFDRSEIQDNDYIQSLAGLTSIVTASGTYTLINSDNEIIEVSFSKFSYCEIVRPGKK